MPYASKAQSRFTMKHPKMTRKFDQMAGPQANLPEYAGDKSDQSKKKKKTVDLMAKAMAR